MHKLICSRCLQKANLILPSLSHSRLSCSHTRPYSRWFALYEDVTPVEIPFSELPPSSSSYIHEAPIGLNDPSSSVSRRLSLVPTLVDSSELGGRDAVEDDIFGNVQGPSSGSPFSSIYDSDSLLATFEDSNLEVPAIGGILSRDLLPVFAIPGSLQLRNIASNSNEKEQVERTPPRIQGVRSRLRSISTCAAATTIMSEPKIGKIEDKEGNVNFEIEQDIEIPIRDGEMNIQFLIDLVKNSDMDGLRSLIASSFWPRATLSPHQVSRIFTLVVSKAKDCEECREIMRDFACSSPRHSLPSHIPILLASRSVREEGIQRALEAIQFHNKAFIMAPISLRVHSSLRVSATRSLWMEVAKRSEGDIMEMHERGVKFGLLEGTKELVEETLRQKWKSGASFSCLFRQWREMGGRYGNQEDGMGTVVRSAMEEIEKDKRKESLLSISSFVSSCPSLKVETFIVHLVMNLLLKDEEKAAKHVFGLFSIHGKHWKEILEELERNKIAENLALVEKIANLISYGVIGELRKKEKKPKSNSDDWSVSLKMEEDEKIEVKDELCEIMEKIVWKANGGKNEKRKKKGAWKTKKRVKIDHKEVHELALRIQTIWMDLENAINGSSSEGMTRLYTWSILHRLSIPDSISHIISNNGKNMFKRESCV